MVSFYWIFHLKCKGLYPSVRPSDRSEGRLASPIRVNITRIPTPLPKSIFSNRLQHTCIEAQIKILSVSYNFFLEMKPQGFFFFFFLWSLLTIAVCQRATPSSICLAYSSRRSLQKESSVTGKPDTIGVNSHIAMRGSISWNRQRATVNRWKEQNDSNEYHISKLKTFVVILVCLFQSKWNMPELLIFTDVVLVL